MFYLLEFLSIINLHLYDASCEIPITKVQYDDRPVPLPVVCGCALDVGLDPGCPGGPLSAADPGGPLALFLSCLAWCLVI